MSSIEIIALALGALTIASALMVVLSMHPVRSVLYLILTFFLISANYVLLNAQFLAIVNIVVYAGAIMVLFLFVLMLLNLSKDNEPRASNIMKLAASLAAGALVIVLVAALKDAIYLPVVENVQGNSQGLVENLGQLLFTKYVLPFETSSVLFIAAMVGAVLLSKKEKQIID
ncbi:NADH-quinone oxidoreductase subunit J [Crocinitomicaceae bacterium CZZ-1]|uniref:NADH-quinone oxidoreductase subunit J n=1 Tax=Taishania pollutisoli TaxID=2766479 RepID=A0A8J6PHM3_9FLAO|nr:NADH-quinone oxidoreductase subunit J [Taishania pollutisoli]MBC9811684.1 NADH-quinone oxidoreductase subunit J [Taishania pollutisoli]MBX2948381.1 NADH-quinone oxidoreductase subunit J [Crocinitomicaceae bacterium]NGF75479.1 NADH-quinone oxidoreductase subunit J [Fluviicola sp. SGL-29]